MTRNTHSPIRAFADTKGNHCSAIPLGNNAGEAIIFTADLLELEAHGVPARWVLNDNGTGTKYVRAHRHDDNTVTVARIIMRASPRQVVEHIDGNRLNLRRDNLRVLPRGKRARAGALAELHAAQFAADIAAVAPVAAQEARA